jgi:hypothetical protein
VVVAPALLVLVMMLSGGMSAGLVKAASLWLY